MSRSITTFHLSGESPAMHANECFTDGRKSRAGFRDLFWELHELREANTELQLAGKHRIRLFRAA